MVNTVFLSYFGRPKQESLVHNHCFWYENCFNDKTLPKTVTRKVVKTTVTYHNVTRAWKQKILILKIRFETPFAWQSSLLICCCCFQYVVKMSVSQLVDRPKPSPNEERSSSHFVDCWLLCWWYSSEYAYDKIRYKRNHYRKSNSNRSSKESKSTLSLLPRKEARSRFLSMCSLGWNQRCSRHSSVVGRLLWTQYKNNEKFKRYLTKYEILWRPFEDQHDETSSFHAYLLVKRFESETDVRYILLCFFIVLAAII